MGCCFSSSEGTSNVPLLSHQEKPVPSRGTGTGPATTARRYRATDAFAGTLDVNPELDSHDIKPISVRPVKVSVVEKRIQDHAQLYNDHVDRRRRLQELLAEMRSRFPENNPHQTLHGCFMHLRNLCRGCESIQVTRRYQFCMEVEYNGKEVDHSAIEVFIHFNRANKIIKEIIDKGPGLVNSIELVINTERELRREVLVASLGEEGPECMKNCMDNIGDLRRVPANVEDIKRETMKVFEELKAAASLLVGLEARA